MFRPTAISVVCLHYRPCAFTYSFSRSTCLQCMIAMVSRIRSSIKERHYYSCQISIHHDSETYNEMNFPRKQQLFGSITCYMQVRSLLVINNNRAKLAAQILAHHQFLEGQEKANSYPTPPFSSNSPKHHACNSRQDSNIPSPTHAPPAPMIRNSTRRNIATRRAAPVALRDMTNLCHREASKKHAQV